MSNPIMSYCSFCTKTWMFSIHYTFAERKNWAYDKRNCYWLNPLRSKISEGGGESILLQGTQAMPARPSDKDRMEVKTLGWWVVKAWDRDGRILFHVSLLSVDIIWKFLKPKLVYITFKNLGRTSKTAQHFTITNINWLTLFKEIIPIYTKSYKTH
jgi:hypothetical protein